MLPKLLVVAQHYALLLLLVAAAWGLGRAALRLILPPVLAGPFRHPVSLSVGLGLLIVVLQLLAVAGWLRAGPLAGVALATLGLAAVELARCPWRASLAAGRATWRAMPPATRLLAAAALALAASTMLRPLAPPRDWDELMYHLPHAVQWAASGQLTVNDWLRYPWFPYNYNLLYAAALVAGNDLLPHFLHALAGWITALLLLAWARGHFGWNRALLATVLWLWLTRDYAGNAYIDLGVTLFLFLAYLALERWWQEREGGWLVLCAFALGVAVGAKYQALAVLPFALGVAAIRRPGPRLAAAAVLAFLIPCAYWYVRNFVLAGDPVAPLGGRIFGFTDWNLVDYEMQMADLRRVASAPPRLLWPAVLGIGWALVRGSAALRLAAAFALWFLLSWAASSRYARYLLPAYPVLVVFAVLGWEHLLRAAARVLRRGWLPGIARGVGLSALLAVVAVAGGMDLARSWRSIATSSQERDALLAEQLVGYRMWQYLRDHPQGRIYQVRLEDGIYYAPRPIWGDHFGPWRYGDYVRLDAAALRQRLLREGFDALLVHTGRAAGIVRKQDFARHFDLHHREGQVMLFAIRKGPLP